MSTSGLNTRNPTIKRILRELKELRADTSPHYTAEPCEDNIFEWHFTIRGPNGSAFEGGIYHGKILLPIDYPFKPPSIVLLTPNGRFETGKKVCLTISAHHPETWQPSWSIRTALVAIIGFLPTPGKGAIGALDYSAAERRRLAARSVDYVCPECGASNATALPELPDDEESAPPTVPTDYDGNALETPTFVAVPDKSSAAKKENGNVEAETKTSEKKEAAGGANYVSIADSSAASKVVKKTQTSGSAPASVTITSMKSSTSSTRQANAVTIGNSTTAATPTRAGSATTTTTSAAKAKAAPTDTETDASGQLLYSSLTYEELELTVRRVLDARHSPADTLLDSIVVGVALFLLGMLLRQYIIGHS